MTWKADASQQVQQQLTGAAAADDLPSKVGVEGCCLPARARVGVSEDASNPLI